MSNLSRKAGDAEEVKVESGDPGGGKGRKDEVGGSGFYPTSGSRPAGHAELKGQASEGQDERGAAGYEPRMTEAHVEVAHSQWTAFLDSFSRQHLDWLVTVEIVSPKGRLVAVEERPLKGISMDSVEGKERVYVQVGQTPDEHVTHTIERPTRMMFKQSQLGAHRGLEIACGDGTTTVIRFRSAMSPEMLDGIAA